MPQGANGADATTATTAALRQPARTLLRRLAALPALCAAAYPRALQVPPLVQLGYFPPDGKASYEPHLDRWPHEQRNKRELTFLLYVNVGWDARQCGGHLKLHPSSPESTAALPRLPTATEEIAPLAGRLVIFQSKHVLHEVMPCRHVGRLALTLWVEAD